MQRGRARVTDDGSLCLGVSRFGVSNSASHCELRHWKNPNSRALATLCDNLCRSMEARGDQKIHTFYCWRLKESTPASCHCLQCCCALVCVSVCGGGGNRVVHNLLLSKSCCAGSWKQVWNYTLPRPHITQFLPTPSCNKKCGSHDGMEPCMCTSMRT